MSGYCPSQDWDRYVEADNMNGWVCNAYTVSNLIATVDYWMAKEEVERAVINDEYIVWACQIKVKIPYNPDAGDIEVDNVALAVRTLHRKMRELKVFRVTDQEFAIFARIPSMSPEWRVVPGSGKPTQLKAESYLAFCCSEEDRL